MKALIVTITKRPWPENMVSHWHIVDSYLSRHVVGAIHAVYKNLATIEEIEWERDEPRTCPHCQAPLR